MPMAKASGFPRHSPFADHCGEGKGTPSGTTYGQYATNNFTVAADPHTIEFLGVDPTGGDNTAFIDDVQLNA